MVELDSVDRRLLMEMQTDASRPIAEVAARIGLSPSPCWRRLKRLREAGVITAQVALIDPKAVGLGVTVYASVTLRAHSEANVAAFDRFVGEAPEVTECLAVTGDRDYILRIAVPDIEAYERFLSGRLLHLPFIAAVNSRFALRRVKYTTALPLVAAEA